MSVPLETVYQLIPEAFRKSRRGEYTVKKTDHLLRLLLLPSEHGLREEFFNDSREASVVGEYWNAVRFYLDTRQLSKLNDFEGVSVRNSRGELVPLLTDPDELLRQASFGTLQFESIYGRTE